MITLTILLVALLAVAITVGIAALVGGTGFLLAFGDVIIAGLVIWAIVRLIRRGK